MPTPKLGRPRIDPADSSKAITVRVPSRLFDAICREAIRERVTVADWIRRKTEVEAPERK